ncbi:hypothetical protein SN13T_0855 [Lactiplantibacillus plantarum]|nr:hypothetical protein SN13T_0855 [Lactiplantibacillus plantarum]
MNISKKSIIGVIIGIVVIVIAVIALKPRGLQGRIQVEVMTGKTIRSFSMAKTIKKQS